MQVFKFAAKSKAVKKFLFINYYFCLKICIVRYIAQTLLFSPEKTEESKQPLTIKKNW